MLLPLLWRYLFLQYGKTLALTLAGFLLVLLSTRLEEAAKLVSFGTSLGTVALFILYQIPYVMQIALPISTLIGALYLFQRLSTNNELTAARASGISLFELVTPLVLLSGLIGVLSFTLFFDVSVHSHLEAKKLEYSIRQMQPLAILQNSRLLDSRGIKLDMKGSLISDKYAEDLVIAMASGENGHATLIITKEVSNTKNMLFGKNTAIVTTKDGKDKNAFDDLLIENSEKNSTSLNDLALFTNKRRMWKAGNDLLQLHFLLAKRKELLQKVEVKKYQEKSPKSTIRKIRKVDAELTRRLSLAFSIVSFTLVGAAFGCTIGRMNRRRRFMYAVLLVGFYLISYLAAKGLEAKPIIAMILYSVPHIVILVTCTKRLSNIQRGVET